MTPDERRFLGIAAKMDQERQAAMDHGPRIEVSQIELLALANLAKYGIYHAILEMGINDADQISRVRDCATELLKTIKQLDGEYEPDTTPRLITTCAAILDGERIGQYVMED